MCGPEQAPRNASSVLEHIRGLADIVDRGAFVLGRPETNQTQRLAMSVLGNGLTAAGHDEDSLTVQEARLSLMRRLEDSEGNILIVQTCLANSLMRLGRNEQASNMLRDIYSARVRLNGEEHRDTIIAALNYASSLGCLRRVEEVKSLLRKTIPAARRVLGENNEITLRVKLTYVTALGLDTGATLDDVREAVTMLEESERTARRVLGSAHPLTTGFESNLRKARAALRARKLQGKTTN